MHIYTNSVYIIIILLTWITDICKIELPQTSYVYLYVLNNQHFW